MSFNTSLFEAERLRLGPIEREKDPPVMAAWTRSAEFARSLGRSAARPLSAAQVRKQLETIEKQMDEKCDQYYFTLRLRADGRLIGYARIFRLDLANGNASLELAIGAAEDRGQGYGTEALGLLLHFAKDELRLRRVSAAVPAYNTAARRLLGKAGFVEEVRQREAIRRNGQYHDLLRYGLLFET